MSSPKFIATCWTSSGNAAPLEASEVSPHSAFERLDAIAATGWSGFGFAAPDLLEIEKTVGFEAVYERAQELGLHHIEVELATNWWLPEESGWHETWQLLMRAATQMHAKMIKIGSAFGDPVDDFSHMVKPFRRLAEEAAGIGAVVALEPLPFALIGSMPQGADLCAEVNHPGAGLLVDYWHVFRANTSLEELEKRVPVEKIFGIELDDAVNEIVGTLFEDTRDNRTLLGEGDQDVVGFIKTIQRMGYTGDWGVEMLSKEHRAKPLRQGLQDAIDSAKKVFELASH
ncbi:sugar phosphate isomerase/epimerase family protein [Rhodoluna sp.]|uniref:sugar phosphate isomerase/epimerase family protein n=1 Tax=Rhodoluna sp. TaxID=1969481 RepID=UPI0025FE0F4C|nr:sugar phosphate isomerase/epimerase family protein [Rhodoluna sp.]